MNEEIKKKFIQWLIDEEALVQEENVVHAEKAFFANSFLNWWVKGGKKKKLNDKQFRKCMLILRLFLKGELDLYWDGDIIKKQEVRLNGQRSKDGSSNLASEDE